MKRKYGQWVKKTAVVLLGVCILGFGVNFFVYADVGADPMTTCTLGLCAFIGRYRAVSTGTAYLILNGIVFLLAVCADYRKIGFGTAASALGAGFFIDFWRPVVEKILPADPAFSFALAAAGAGCLINSIGLAAYMSAGFGLGAGEILPVIAAEKTGVKFRYAKIAGDLIFFLTGAALGGGFGAGTVISLILIGPLIHRFLPLMKKLFGFL